MRTLAGVLLLGAWIALQPPGPVPPFLPHGDQAVYELQTAPAVSTIEPILYAPWHASATATSSGLFAAALVVGGLLVSAACGASGLAAFSAVAALMLSGPMSATARQAGPDALAVAIVWWAWWIVLTPVAAFSVAVRTTIALAMLLAGAWWSCGVLLGAPLIVASAWPQIARRARVMAVVATAIVAVGAAVVWSLHLASISTASAFGSVVVDSFDVWDTLRSTSARPGRVLFIAPELGALWSPLAFGLASVALVIGPWHATWKRAYVTAIVVWGVAWMLVDPLRVEILRLSIWLLTPAVACGLTWISEQTASARRLGTSALGVAMCAASLTGAARPVGSADARSFAGAFGDSLRRAQREAGERRIAIVAEDTLVDSAVATFGPGLQRLPQDPDRVAQAFDQGVIVLAGPTARRHLSLSGLEFTAAREVVTPSAQFSWSRLDRRLHCATLHQDRWSHLPGLEFTGRLGLELPAGEGGALHLIVGDALPVSVDAEDPNGAPLVLASQALDARVSFSELPPDYWLDGGDPRLAPAHVLRASIPAMPQVPRHLAVRLGRRSPRVLARLSGYSHGKLGRVCAAAPEQNPIWHASTAPVRLPLDLNAYFGTGWYGVERFGVEPFRWTGADGVILIPSSRRVAVRVAVRVRAAAEPDADGPRLVLHVNNIPLEAHRIRPGLDAYSWDVRRQQWVLGVNELRFHVTRTVRPSDRGGDDRRVLGLAVHGVMLTPVP